MCREKEKISNPPKNALGKLEVSHCMQNIRRANSPRRGVFSIFLGEGVSPGPENPYPISDQKIRFSIPYFRPDSQNVYHVSDPVMCDNFGNSQ